MGLFVGKAGYINIFKQENNYHPDNFRAYILDTAFREKSFIRHPIIEAKTEEEFIEILKNDFKRNFIVYSYNNNEYTNDLPYCLSINFIIPDKKPKPDKKNWEPLKQVDTKICRYAYIKNIKVRGFEEQKNNFLIEYTQVELDLEFAVFYYFDSEIYSIKLLTMKEPKETTYSYYTNSPVEYKEPIFNKTIIG